MIFINFSGAPGPLTAVQQLGVAMATPAGKPSVEFRSLRLSKDDPGDALLEPGALVDEFGQWIHDDWPGKARNLDDLKTAWAAEEKSLAGREHASTAATAAIKIRRRRRPASFVWRRSRASGGSSIPTGICSFPWARTRSASGRRPPSPDVSRCSPVAAGSRRPGAAPRSTRGICSGGMARTGARSGSM